MYNPQITVIRIKELSDNNSLTLKQINETCGLNKNTINLSANSKTGLNAKALFDISDCLNCSVDYLLGRTDNPNITAKTYINGENSIQAVVGGAIENNTVTISATDEMTKEIGLLLSNLTYRQKTDLMKQIYDFVDDIKKKES